MLIAFFTVLCVANADISSGPETCVIENYDSARCQVCSDATYEDPDACSRKYYNSYWSLACKSNGASVWDEIWCETVPPQPSPCSAAGGSGVGALALLAVSGLGLLTGRRRR